MKDEVSGGKLIIGYLGIILMLIGGIILLPLVILPVFPEEISQAKYFLIPGVGAILTGYTMALLIRDKAARQLQGHQDAVIVVGSWILAINFCAMPFMLTGKYNYTQAVFECTSGWSTTGLSVVDVTACPKLFLMFRSVMLFFGGVGLVLVMISVLSDRYGMQLYNAEGHSDRLLPNLVKSARMIVVIYSGYILSGTILYMVFGMDWFDALNHSIAALSTGGFSTRAESIGYYNSFGIEMVTIVLMLLGATNFLAHLYLIKGRFGNFFRYCEVKFQLIFCAAAAPVLGVLLLYGGFAGNMSKGLRDGMFQAVSALTTTGFQSVPGFADWTGPLLFVMIALMLIGGGTGSTAGGIKQIRVCMMLKSMICSLRSKITCKRIVHTDTIRRLDRDEALTPQNRVETLDFILTYLGVFAIGTFILCMCGYPIGKSMFEFSSSLGTVGLSAGITAYDARPVILWTETAGMFIGRLEIYVVFIAIAQIYESARTGIKEKRRRHHEK